MQSFDAATLAIAYGDGKLSPPDVVEEAFARIAARGEDGVWIALAPTTAKPSAPAEVTNYSSRGKNRETWRGL